MVVIDLDEILDEDGSLLGVMIAGPGGEPAWPAYDRLWMRILAIIFRSGHSVVLLSPEPSPGDLGPEGWVVPPQWLLLDCPDDVRRERLRARGWDDARVEEAIADAAQGRRLIPDAIRPEPRDSPAEISRRVLARIAAR